LPHTVPPLAAAALRDPAIRKTALAPEDGTCPAVLSGLSAAPRAHLLAAVRAETGRQVVYIAADASEARRAAADLRAFTGEDAATLAEREFNFRDMEGVSRDFERTRLRALYEIACGATVITAHAAALMQRAIPKDALLRAAVTLAPGETRPPEELIAALTGAGYIRAETVEAPGQYARRGGILDFWSPANEEPIRCELWGDEIDTLTFFDPATQRRGEPCGFAQILPAAESLPSLAPGGEQGFLDALAGLSGSLRGARSERARESALADAERLRAGRVLPSSDRYAELISPFAAALDFLAPDAVVLISDPARVAEAAERYEKRLAEEVTALLEAGLLDASRSRFALTKTDFFAQLERFSVIMCDAFTVSNYPIRPKSLAHTVVKQLPGYGGSLETAAADALHYGGRGFSTVVLVSSQKRGEILLGYFREAGVSAYADWSLAAMPEPGRTAIALGAVSAGMEYPAAKLAVITEGQLTEQSLPRKTKAHKKSNRERVQNYTDLAPGDLVVHDAHGIGRYAGLFTMTVDAAPRDYIKIQFQGADALYIPATQLDSIAKYIGGGEDSAVRLSKMGGGDWNKQKSRARASARDMAAELIALYAERSRVRGHAFAPDSVWQREFEDGFGYEETDDQLRSVAEIKSDMEKNVPMDRILCGDVGYGKTEVALRAVMKCVLDGYQAAILVPTTVLCSQHFRTASERFAGLPVTIGTLSRFSPPREIKKTLAGLESGAVDLVIGTHRLLSKDIRFKKLGLLVVDEEQRFGVAHKERLKELAKRVDALTLSATPIPRTLNMALSGIRDMSTIEEPPTGRQPVQTYVMEHDWNVLGDAVLREFDRGGQVYFLHNRIDTIDRTAAKLRELAPEASIAVAHGRMDEETLSGVMERVVSGEAQILVCTTIIETGIDIPNVNTLIIEDADKMGLAQLHQIRGRVGRSRRRAYAYLTFRRGKVLSEVAEKRLSAIREFAEFNSGFKIALRDLEIRGAGSLLGAEQSGHMMKVGYDMYLRLLEEAVAEEQGAKPKPKTVCAADLSVTARLPQSYVASGETRLDLYRRIARVETEDDAADILDELIDRFGDPPEEAANLVKIARLRYEASQTGVSDIAQKGKLVRLKLDVFDPAVLTAVYQSDEFRGRVRLENGASPAVTLRINADPLGECARFIAAWKDAAER
jgi:transcription-repair coupling factor (superfamily II helicase)